ncbi:MAG: Maf family protein [Actinomycetota bacterium]|nr:Maf family protein [Actinomycetota bacterium]
MTLILASRSPQRRAILTQLGLEFRIVEPSYEELPLPLAPAELAERHSIGKARSVEPGAGEIVLGVDTLVVIDDQVLGKPADAPEAAGMLALLAGRTHHVVSGLTLRDDVGERTGHARTAVRFRALDGWAIDEYVARGEWRGRAGGYAIQEAGAALVSNIEGCFFNVVGLPVALLVEMLEQRRRRVSG